MILENLDTRYDALNTMVTNPEKDHAKGKMQPPKSKKSILEQGVFLMGTFEILKDF